MYVSLIAVYESLSAVRVFVLCASRGRVCLVQAAVPEDQRLPQLILGL